MKVNLQKIIALIAVLAVTVSILNIAVYASDTSSTMTSREYRNAQSNLIDKYANGDITFTQFQNQSQAVTNEYIAKNTVDGVVAESALTVGNTMTAVTAKMANIVEQYGDDARSCIKDWWDNACKKSNVPTETTQTSNEDYKGYGAVVITADGNYKDYCQYVVIHLANNSMTEYAPIMRSFKRIDGSFSDGTVSNSDVFFGANALSWKYYGDIRYVDGTPAPTDDVFEYGTIHKFDEMNDKQLIDLLNEFSEELERQNPDLSSLEGLLAAIYARLGTLDSDNDNDLLSQILVAIKVFENDVKDCNTEIISLLNDIKDAIVYGNENNEILSEQLKNIIDNMILPEDFEIDEDIYNNRLEVLKNRILGKFSFIHNMKTFVENCFEQYSNTENIPEISFTYGGKEYNVDFSVFNQHISFVQWLLAAFIYISYAYHTYRKIPSYINGGDNE